MPTIDSCNYFLRRQKCGAPSFPLTAEQMMQRRAVKLTTNLCSGTAAACVRTEAPTWSVWRSVVSAGPEPKVTAGHQMEGWTKKEKIWEKQAAYAASGQRWQDDAREPCQTLSFHFFHFPLRIVSACLRVNPSKQRCKKRTCERRAEDTGQLGVCAAL